MLHIAELTYRVGGRLLFDRASVAVPKGHRVGLVGRNGAGKTTLLRLIAGELAPDGGAISLPTATRIGTVPQEAPDGPGSVLDTVLAFDRERDALLAEAETARDPHRIAEIHARLADKGAHAAPARAAKILSGLGFDQAAQARPCGDFSGGWRMRVALAGVLFIEPDLLLLDEPTNHLDLEAALWLENHLSLYPHTVILVSHDRDLLDRVPTTTIHLDRGRLVSYAGGYGQFVRTRTADRQRLAAEATRIEAQRRHMQAFVDRFRYKASKARQAQSRLKALERLAPVASVVDEVTVGFDFPEPAGVRPPLLALDGVAVGYASTAVLRRLDMRIDMDDRIALLGMNGNGKSTLVKLLADRLRPLEGTVHRSAKLKVGYFAQHQAEELDLGLTAFAEMRHALPQATPEQVRAHLGRFGFPQQQADTIIGRMSGGEKARLLFALMSAEKPNILLLDEPTNHLDVGSREALVQAINGFAGAVVLISHDAHLIELTADRLWLVAEGTCRPFDGDLDDYRTLLLEQSRAERSARSGDGRDKRKGQRRASAEARVAMAPLKRKAEQAERTVASLARQRQELVAKLADSALYAGPADAVTKLQIDLSAVEKRIAAAEQAWVAATEELELAAAEADA